MVVVRKPELVMYPGEVGCVMRRSRKEVLAGSID